MPRRIGYPDEGYVGGRKFLRYNHRFVITAAGAILAGSQDDRAKSGVLAAKTGSEVGRYTLTLNDKAKQFRGGQATLIGPADATFGALTVGLMNIFRNDLLSTNAQSVDLQFVNASGNFTDAELPSGTIVIVDFLVLVG